MSFDYMYIECNEDVDDVVNKLGRASSLGIDCEADRIGSNFKLCLIQVSDTSKVYIFDVLKLGKSIFDKGLRQILENPDVLKLFYDCKEDCGSLYSQYGVDVKGIFDLQVLDLFQRRVSGIKGTEFVNGLARSMGRHLPGNSISKRIKDEMHAKFARDNQFWSRRPLDEQSLTYAGADAAHLHKLKEALMNAVRMPPDQLKDLIKYASTRHADFARRNDKYVSDGTYIRTARFPINIIPQYKYAGGKLSFEIFPENMTKRCCSCGMGCRDVDMSHGSPQQCMRCCKIDVAI